MGLLWRDLNNLDMAEKHVTRSVSLSEDIQSPDLGDRRQILASLRRQRDGDTPMSDNEMLQKLVAVMGTAFEVVPEDQRAKAEKVARRTEELVSEISSDERDIEAIESRVNLLQKAAENIQEALPTVAALAKSIVTFSRQITGLP